MKKQYENLINSSELSDNQKLLLNTIWLGYFDNANKRAWNNWWNYHVLSILVIIISILIPVLEESTIRMSVLGKNFSIVSVFGIMIAIITGIMTHWKFESRWKHYRLNTELIRSEGEDFFALSNRYSKFGSHSDAFKEFSTILTKFKRKEIQMYIENLDDKNKSGNEK